MVSARTATWLPLGVCCALLLACVRAAVAQTPAAPEAGAAVAAPATPPNAAAAAGPEASAQPSAPAPAVTPPPEKPNPFAPEAQPAAEPRTKLRKSIAEARLLADALETRVFKLQQANTLSSSEARAHEDALDALTTLLRSFDDRAKALEKAKSSSGKERQQATLAREVSQANAALASIGAQLEDLEAATGWGLVDELLTARCATAICFDNGELRHWLGIEPLVELPIGIGFAVGGSSLADYVNNHDIRVDLAAGVRVWLFRDVVSVSVYLSKPLLDTSVRVEGSSFVYPGSSLRRPFPGLAIGLLFDSIWIGFDRNELRNGDGVESSALNPEFPPNTVVSSAWTVTLALQPVTAFRTAIGAANQANEERP